MKRIAYIKPRDYEDYLKDEEKMEDFYNAMMAQFDEAQNEIECNDKTHENDK